MANSIIDYIEAKLEGNKPSWLRLSNPSAGACSRRAALASSDEPLNDVLPRGGVPTAVVQTKAGAAVSPPFDTTVAMAATTRIVRAF